MTELKNSFFALQLDPEKGAFSIRSCVAGSPELIDAHLGVHYRQKGHSQVDLQSGWENARVVTATLQTRSQGTLDCLTFSIPGRQEAVSYELTFGLAQASPLLMWKLKVTNHGGGPIEIEKLTLLDVDPALGGLVALPSAQQPAQMGFYHNGWQSWSPVGWVAGDGLMPRTHLGILQAPMIYNTGTPRPGGRGQFSSDFFAAVGDRVARSGFVLGFLAQKQQFGSIHADFNAGPSLQLWANGDGVRIDDGKNLETDWAVFTPIRLDDPDPLGGYLAAVARENEVHVPASSPLGWCSWYHFYTHLSAEDVRSNLRSIVSGQERLPVQLVQIDDGFESQVGDWFSFKPAFPEGVKPLAQEIKQEGLIPGLWLAPFIVHPGSQLYREHPDWILRKVNGRPANAGYVWGRLDTALDLTVPEALEYACNVIRTAAHEWGYPYLKLDFLYAAALPGRYHDLTRTRAQVLRSGMEAIRSAAGPEVTLLGCGAPLGSVLGLVEAMRIGPDVSGDWVPVFDGIKAFIHDEPSYPCARNSIRNILTRAPLHGRWWVNDPDCLLIRPDTHLSLDEVQSLATAIAMTGGSLLLSDDLPKLPAERRRIAELLLPVLGQRARVLDWFDTEMPALLRLDLRNETGDWHLAACFNWQETAVDLELTPELFGLESSAYWVSDFWQERTLHLDAGAAYHAANVPPHGVVVCAFRREQPGPQYLGGNLHISQGQEVSRWRVAEDGLDFTLNLPRTAEGFVSLHLPWAQVSVTCESLPVVATRSLEGAIEFPVKVPGQMHIQIRKQQV